MGSAGTRPAAPGDALRVSHRAVRRGQALATVPGAPGWLAFVPTAQAVAFGLGEGPVPLWRGMGLQGRAQGGCWG